MTRGGNVAPRRRNQPNEMNLLLQRVVFLAVVMGGLTGAGAYSSGGAGTGSAAVPFASGEQLDYRISWNSALTAATARMRVVEQRPFFGRTAWHFQTRAQTVEPIRFLYKLDDQFDSYTDAATLAGMQYEMYIREQNRNEDSVIRMSPEGEPAGDDGPTVRVPAGTRDPLGFLYSLRAMDWSRADAVKMNVYDGKKLYELRIRRLATAQPVTVPAGSYAATKLEMRAFERGREVRNTLFNIWLSEDSAKRPVLIEADLPIGTFRVELERAK